MTVPEVYKVYNSILSEFQRRGYRERLSYVRTFLRQIDFHNMIAWLLGLAEDWRVVGGAGSPDQNRQYAEMVEEIAAEINNRLPWLENGLQDTLESGNAMRPEWCPPPLYEPQEAEIEGPEWRDSLAGWEWGMWYLLSETAALSTVEEIGGPPR